MSKHIHGRAKYLLPDQQLKTFSVCKTYLGSSIAFRFCLPDNAHTYVDFFKKKLSRFVRSFVLRLLAVNAELLPVGLIEYLAK